MTLREVASMTSEQRAERREIDEACFRSVEAFCANGMKRNEALTKASVSLRIAREDVIAGYWRHVRRKGLR